MLKQTSFAGHQFWYSPSLTTMAPPTEVTGNVPLASFLQARCFEKNDGCDRFRMITYWNFNVRCALCSYDFYIRHVTYRHIVTYSYTFDTHTNAASQTINIREISLPLPSSVHLHTSIVHAHTHNTHSLYRFCMTGPCSGR